MPHNEKRRDFGTRSFLDEMLSHFRLHYERRVIALEQRLRKSERDNLALRTEVARVRTELGLDRRAGGEG